MLSKEIFSDIDTIRFLFNDKTGFAVTTTLSDSQDVLMSADKSQLPQAKTNQKTAFRADINGLRAWAILGVVLYHFHIPFFDGGFSGVDVFFVISGYLMTRIVVSSLEKGQGQRPFIFLYDFYKARVQRIVPALLALCSVLTLFSVTFLMTDDRNGLLKHISKAVLFVSNQRFFKEAGYFDTNAQEKWLLHTWSLSVEWQFYIFFPLILWGIWKFFPSRKAVLVSLSGLWVASFATGIITTQSDASWAFYMLTPRAWEMIAGGLIFLCPLSFLSSVTRKSLEIIGFFLIAGGFLMWDSTMLWPSYNAFVPVLGAVLMLSAQKEGSVLTAPAVLQWLGTRSYSLYLWHWPLTVALVYADLQYNPTAQGIGLVLTVILGHLSYHTIEQPTQSYFRKTKTPWKGLGILALVIIGLLLICDSVKNTNIKPLFGSEQAIVASQERLNKNPRSQECLLTEGLKDKPCIYGGSDIKAVLIGDSHGDAVVTALQSALPQSSQGVMAWTYSGCPSIFGVKYTYSDIQKNKQCPQFMENAYASVQNLPSDVPVIFVNRMTSYVIGQNEPWEKYHDKPLVYFSKPYYETNPAFTEEFSQNFVDTVCRFQKTRPVFLLRPIPEMGVHVPNTIARGLISWQSKAVSISQESYQKRHHAVQAMQDKAHAQCGVTLLDTQSLFCQKGVCSGTDETGRPLYYDDDHLSEYGNKKLIPLFQQIFSQ